MAWYNVGTVDVTNGSATVTGTNTLWDTQVIRVGDGFQGPDSVLYEVAAVNSAGQITLARPYAGVNAAGAEYRIVPTRHLGVQQHAAVQELLGRINTQIDPLADWQAAREAELAAAWRSDNDGSGSGLDADLLDGLEASAFRKEVGGTLRPTHMGVYAHSGNDGLKRFNFKLLGCGIPLRNSMIHVRIGGYAYSNQQPMDFLFAGYNYNDSASIISASAIDMTGNGLACGFTRSSDAVYAWIELNSSHAYFTVEGMTISTAYLFEPRDGFAVIKTDQGVAVT